jgi:hypothetical protein
MKPPRHNVQQYGRGGHTTVIPPSNTPMTENQSSFVKEARVYSKRDTLETPNRPPHAYLKRRNPMSCCIHLHPPSRRALPPCHLHHRIFNFIKTSTPSKERRRMLATRRPQRGTCASTTRYCTCGITLLRQRCRTGVEIFTTLRSWPYWFARSESEPTKSESLAYFHC